MKEEFKKFIETKPELVSYVNSGQMTWQKFYEMYTLYGKDSKVWDDYKDRNISNGFNVSKINELIKNVNMDSIKDHINTAQKALDFVQELTSKTPSQTPTKITPPRPINKFFED